MSKQPKRPSRKAPAPGASRDIRLSEHPRARRQIRQAKAWGGLGACALAAYVSWHGGASFVDTALRAILWGTIAYVVVWACAQQIWRQLALAELRAAEKRALEHLREAEEAARLAEQEQQETAVTGGGQ
jgi:hypothetical protein